MRTVALIVPRGIPSAILREAEDVVPEPRLEVALELREVEVRPRPALEQPLRVAVRGRRRSRRAWPRRACRRPRRGAPAGASRAGGRGARRPRRSASSSSRPCSSEIVRSIASREVLLAADDVLPRRRVRVLEVGHEDPRARVERVDDHLAVARGAGDLDAAVLEIGRNGRDAPVAFANLARRLEEVRKLARVDPLLPLGAREEQLLAPPARTRAGARRRGRAPRA